MSEMLRNWTGRVLDNDLTLGEFLGGTQGTAVFATSLSGQKAAIKVIVCDGVHADEQIARLDAAAGLIHPHLLRVLKTGRDELDSVVFVYVVTEFADENLAQVLPERPLSAEETREVLQSTLDTLSFLHAQGFVHADLKPANILAINDQLKLSVDGVHRQGTRLTRDVGAHDAPEASQALTPASDMWSLGMTLVEVLTQQLPLKPASENAGPAVPESVSAPFREIAQHCLLRTPELRWTLADISNKLIGKTSTSVVPATPARVPESARTAVPRSVPVGRTTSKRPAILLGIVAVIVVAIVAIPRLSHKSTPPIPAPASSSLAASQAAPVQTREATESETSAPARAESESSPEKPEPKPSPAIAETTGTVRHISDEPVESPDAPVPASTTSSHNDVVRQVMPEVIPQARRSISGTVRVKLKVNVDSSGTVVDSNFVSRGPSRYFAKVSEEAAKRWKFVPASAEARVWDMEFDFRRGGTQVRLAQQR